MDYHSVCRATPVTWGLFRNIYNTQNATNKMVRYLLLGTIWGIFVVENNALVDISDMDSDRSN